MKETNLAASRCYHTRYASRFLSRQLEKKWARFRLGAKRANATKGDNLLVAWVGYTDYVGYAEEVAIDRLPLQRYSKHSAPSNMSCSDSGVRRSRRMGFTDAENRTNRFVRIAEYGRQGLAYHPSDPFAP